MKSEEIEILSNAFCKLKSAFNKVPLLDIFSLDFDQVEHKDVVGALHANEEARVSSVVA